MKIKLFLIAAFVLFIQSCGPNNSKKQTATNSEITQAIEMLTEFYTHYLTEQDKMLSDGYNPKTIEVIKNNYLTVKLQERLNFLELEYDPFLNAQDFSKDWIKTLEITPVEEIEDAYNVCYHYDNEHTNCITLFLVKENGKFKINDIENLSAEHFTEIGDEPEDMDDFIDAVEFVKTGESIESFVPSGYIIDMQANGDLNHDGLEDLVVVLIQEENDEAKRPVLVLLCQPDNTYVLDKFSWTVVESKYNETLRYEEENINIDNEGVLQHHIRNFGPNINRTCEYKYIDNELCLVSIEAFGSGAGEQREIKLNLLTAELEITTVNTFTENSETVSKIHKIEKVLFESAKPMEIINDILVKYNL